MGEQVYLVGMKNDDGSYTVVKEMKKVRKAKREDFYMGNQIAGADIAFQSDLSKMDLRLIFYFLSQIDYNNDVVVTQSALAEMFLTQHSYISKSINSLISKGIISKVKRNGVRMFHVEEHIAVKGQRVDK